MGWTLDTVLELDVDVYDALVTWLNDQASQARGGEGSVDMDAVMSAKAAKREQDG